MAANTYTYRGTAPSTTGSSPTQVLAPRWSYVTVQNTDTTNAIWVSTDGVTTATVGGDSCFRIAPNQTVVIANMTRLWTQAATVIQPGNLTGVMQPYSSTQMNPLGSSLYGGSADPGVVISSISEASTGGSVFVVSAAG